MKIRRATPDDAPAIATLVGSLAHSFLADPGDRGSAAPFFATITPGAIRASILEDRVLYHLAEVEGGAGEAELAGAVGVRDGRHLYHLFVAEAWHRRRVATRLWATARSVADASGPRPRPRPFTVNASLPAVPVYERWGFVAAGQVTRRDGLAFLPMALEPGSGP